MEYKEGEKVKMKTGKMINLKRASESIGMAMPADNPEKSAPRGPTFYVRDVELPITEKDLNKEMEAIIKIKPIEIRESVVNGEKQCSYDFEVTGIKLG